MDVIYESYPPKNTLHCGSSAHRRDVLDERHGRDEEERRAERLQRLEQQHRLGHRQERVARQTHRVEAERQHDHEVVPEVLYHKSENFGYVNFTAYMIIRITLDILGGPLHFTVDSNSIGKDSEKVT